MKTTLFCPMLFVSVLLLCVRQDAMGQDQLILPPAIQNTVDGAIQCTKAAYMDRRATYDEAKIHAAYILFATAMTQLGAQVDETLAQQMSTLEDRDIRAKLITIARDRRIHPELYQEIEMRYLRQVNSPFVRAPQSPNLTDRHISAKYRLAWEYFLVAPTPAGASALYELRALYAIDGIHNRASVAIMKYCFLLTSSESAWADGPLGQQQQLLLAVIANFHNASALKALLACGIQAVKQQSLKPAYNRWNAESYLHELLSRDGNNVDGVEWRDFIRRQPKDQLSQEERQFLAKVAP
jgi:hypothetical protein